MLNRMKDNLRRAVRGLQRGGTYPILLPHHTLEGDVLTSVDGSRRRLAGALIEALRLCDGQKTLAQASRQSRMARSGLIRAQEEGLLLLWRTAVPAAAPPAERAQPHTIVLSPHLDDAALSCGGRMLQDPRHLVVNVFTRSAWWRFGQADAGLIQRVRSAEEELVSRLTGCALMGQDLPEALLRGYAMDRVFVDGPDERDAEAARAIEAALAELAMKHPLARWLLPLGVGGHIDHRLARDAGMRALSTAGVPIDRVRLYEDLPYAAASEDRPAMAGAAEPLDIEESLEWKMELLRAYWSQFVHAHLQPVRRYARRKDNSEIVHRVG